MPEKVKQFVRAAEKLGIEVRCDPDWDEEGTICITFLNVFDSEGDWVYIMLSPDGYLIES